MSEEHDRIFIRNFSIVIVALMAFTVLIILLSLAIHQTQEREPSAARIAAVEERLQPLAGVYAGETGRAAAQAAAAEAVAEEPEVAFGGSTDGEMIYERVCAACHDAGVAGAPTLARETWGDRLDQDREALIASVIDGLGAMPPRAGRADLSDEQAAASVDYMLDHLD
ncbi:cytochrome c5 family protein [Wenzhouxiangella sp. AB-CW3]|uniref:c-type cytochrome n=1 Tax=Wenzhouxiangella sp. AB-CW3 TaxID=2771012 RepID=UPI00168A7070|nr:c-type cytochrome [Wenzhouxiangella sp. AB-CW3]QOC22205.1 cytochrome c5 family protein [Wenzhouxiangella sp. AB-CW3]